MFKQSIRVSGFVVALLWHLLATAAPVVNLTAPAASTVFQAPGSVAITATATDSASTIANVKFYRDGTTLLSTVTTSPYSYTWTAAPAGAYSITAQATSAAGVTTTSAARSITVNAQPTAAMSASPTTAAAPATIALSATVTDSDGTIASVAFYNGATLLNTDTTSPYSFSWTNVAAGTYTVTAKATDNQGGTKTSTAVTVTVSAANAAPTVSMTATPTTATAPATIALAATAADSDDTIASVAFYNGATLLNTDTTSPYSFSWTNVAAGTYTMTAKATDNKGAVTTSSPVTVTVSAGPPQTYYIDADQINTPRLITNAANQVVWKWEQTDPFGANAANPNPTGTGTPFVFNLRFPGQYYEVETGLHYNYFRHYDPATGKYVQTDPIGLAGGVNTYAYALGNPVRYTDPSGRFVPLVIAGVCAAGGCEAIFSGLASAAIWWGLNHNKMNGPIRSDSVSGPTCPPAPDGIVGEQGDLAGPNKNGKRHTSGPLTPGNGGNGNAQDDFDRLTGGTGQPFPGTDSRSKIPGAQVGDNGVWIRPGTKNPGDGPRIEIPGIGNKLPETLHY